MVHTVHAPWRTAMRQSAAVVALVLLVLAPAAALPESPAPQAGAPQAGQAKDLTLIPPDAAAFCRLRVGDFWKSELYKKLKDDKTFSGQFATDFRNKIGVEPTAIETVTCVALKTPGGQPAQKGDLPVVVIVTTNQPLDAKTIVKKAMPEAEERRHGSRTYYLAKKDHGPAVCFLDDQLVILGNEKALLQIVDGEKGVRTDGPLAPMIKQAAQHHIAAAFQGPPGQGLKLKDGKPLADDAVRALQDLKLGTFTADFAPRKCTAHVHLTFPNEAKAKEALPAVKKGLEHVEMLVIYMANAAIEGQKDPDVSGLTKPLGQIREAIVAAKVEQQGADIRVNFEVMLDANDHAALLRGMARTIFAERHTDQK